MRAASHNQWYAKPCGTKGRGGRTGGLGLITKRQNNSRKKKGRIKENLKSTNKDDQKSSLSFAIIMNQQV